MEPTSSDETRAFGLTITAQARKFVLDHFQDSEYAAVLTLDYEKNRHEHSVVYVSSGLDRLEELLKNPVRFFSRREKDWDELTKKGERCWRMRCPVTAILRIGRKVSVAEAASPDRLQVLRSAGFLQSFVVDGLKQLSTKVGVPDGVRALFDSLDGGGASIAEITQAITSEKGAFVAEFALNTSMLNITYWPPQPTAAASRVNAGGDLTARAALAKQESRFPGRFTQGVLGMTSASVNGLASGALHIDLKSRKGKAPSRVDRVRFIMDCVESISRVPLRLTQETIYRDEVEFHRREDVTDFGTIALENKKKDGRERLEPKDIFIPTNEEEVPIIIAENMCLRRSGIPACCYVQVVQEKVGPYRIVLILIKFYARPPNCPRPRSLR